MQPLHGFALAPADDEAIRSALVEQGRKVAIIEGRELEGVYRCGAGILVMSSDGNPFEEAVHFHLFDENMQELDSLTLGQIYNPGTVRDLQICGEDCLEFCFFSTERWRLIAAKPPRWKIRLNPFSSVRYHHTGPRAHYLELTKLTSAVE